MNRTQIKEALEKARLVIASHGMVAHMPSYFKSSLMNPVSDSTDRLSYEFYLDPNKSGYSSDNYNCALNILYYSASDVERDGGIYRDSKLRVTIRIGSAEVYVQQLTARENMVASLAMLAQMIEATLPQSITTTVVSPEALKERRQLEHEQNIAEKIFRITGKDAVNNLRTGGKSRLIRIPEKYAEIHGAMPDPGRYRFDQVRYINRRGQIKDRAGYVFVVSKGYDDSYNLRSTRVS